MSLLVYDKLHFMSFFIGFRTFVQATTGQGGWPMSVFLTPELEPMYGGTYYPRKDMFQVGVINSDQLIKTYTGSRGYVSAPFEYFNFIYTKLKQRKNTSTMPWIPAPQDGQLAMPSFQTVLRRISTMWSTNQDDLKRKVSGQTSNIWMLHVNDCISICAQCVIILYIEDSSVIS